MNSLNYNHTLHFVIISTKIIKELNNSLINIKSQIPLSSTANIQMENLNNMMSLSFETIIQKAIQTEMLVLLEAFNKINEISDLFVLTQIEPQTEVPMFNQKILKYLSGLIRFLFLPNETVNTLYNAQKILAADNCILSEVACPSKGLNFAWYSYLYNPVGKLILKLLRTQYSQRYKSLYKNIIEINNSPLKQ